MLRHPRSGQAGFSLIELMIVVLIVGILARIAYPSYVKSVTKTKRRAAEACLSNYATYMERFYATNLRYDQDLAGTAISLPTLDCAGTQNTGKDYGYSLSTVAASSYTLQAVPTGKQAIRDTQCGTLTLNQTGTRGAGTTDCW
ncbi:type IV pilin protein [Solimonas soli]|uniref:type IV pilin protein n=1 Tax=Solimonas soli TaxID=413479 RepID=UPI0004846E99|nr:type IV pilin protein [Solimonas soli]